MVIVLTEIRDRNLWNTILRRFSANFNGSEGERDWKKWRKRDRKTERTL